LFFYSKAKTKRKLETLGQVIFGSIGTGIELAACIERTRHRSLAISCVKAADNEMKAINSDESITRAW
jgi:hypothetical protein